jgi:ankyrin repeat protein
MVPFYSNISSSDPNPQDWYAQQQDSQQQEQRHSPIPTPPKAPRMAQRNVQLRGNASDLMDIDSGDDELPTAKRKREESEQAGGEEKHFKKRRLSPSPDTAPESRLEARAEDMTLAVPAILSTPRTSEALEKAIRSDDLQTVIYLLDAGVSTDAGVSMHVDTSVDESASVDEGASVDGGLEKMLIYAARNDATSIVKELLHRGVNVNALDSHRMTALMWAAKQGNFDVAMVLLGAGALTSVADGNESPAIVLAVRAGSAAIVWALLEHGADINEKDPNDDETALMAAVNQGNDEIFSLLLKEQADIHGDKRKGCTALTCAISQNRVDMAERLLNLGININQRYGREKQTALMLAFDNEDLEMFKKLLSLGADVNIYDALGKSALMRAAERGHEEIFSILLGVGANIHARGYQNETVLRWAIKGGSVTIVRWLRNLGANIHAHNFNGETALTNAIGWDRLEIVKELLSWGVDVNTVDRWRRSPLMEAATKGNAKIFSLLLQAGASLMSVDCINKTMLMCAVQGGNLWVVQAILNCAPNIDAVANDGQTALMLAVKYKRLDILHLLLQYGASVNLRGTQVDNATVMAIEQQNMPAFELLLAYDGEPYDLTDQPPPHLSDMRQRRALLKPGVAADAMMLEALYGIPISSMSEISATHSVHEMLTQIFTGLQICSPIVGRIKGQLGDQPDGSNKLMQVLAGMGGILSQSQKSMAIAGLLASLNAWVKSWPKDWTPYKSEIPGTSLSVHVEANLTALVKLQVEKLVELGEQMETKMAIGLEMLMPQCEKYTQVKNGELVIDDERLLAYLAGELGLYSPLSHLVAAAWFDALQDQQQRILAAIGARQQRILDQRKQFESNDLELGWGLSELVDFYASTWTDALPATSIRFAFSEEGVEPALLAAFGAALKQINTVEGGTLLRSSTLQGELADVYTDLMFRQLHMLMQFADQASAAS